MRVNIAGVMVQQRLIVFVDQRIIGAIKSPLVSAKVPSRSKTTVFMRLSLAIAVIAPKSAYPAGKGVASRNPK